MSKKAGTTGTSEAATKKTQTPCCVYDFTLFDDIESSTVKLHLKQLAKKYCFQREKGEETGKLHYQGRLSLKCKKRESELINELKKYWQKFHISITSKANRDNDFYVSKEDTRIEGPFTDKDEEPEYIPKDVRKMANQLRPWQQKIVDMSLIEDDRAIDIIYDPNGNIGKTALCKYMDLLLGTLVLPFVNDFKDIMRMAYDAGPKTAYMIDMPRAICKERLYQLFSGIEALKGGYSYDDRYTFRRRWSDRPRIFVFTNSKPDLTLLSRDMWHMWTVENYDLIPYDLASDLEITETTDHDIDF